MSEGEIEARASEHELRGAEVRRLRAELVAALSAARAYRDLATCYRIGRAPSEALWTRLDAADACLDGAKTGGRS